VLLSVITKTGTRFKSYQDTRNQKTLNSWTNSEFRKLVWNVDQWVGQNVLMIVPMVVHKQTHNHQEHEEHASTRDMNKMSRIAHFH